MQDVFGDHIRQTVEACVDEIIIKTRKADNLVNDLCVVFDCLWANAVKLNPKKCVFGVPRGMLLDTLSSGGASSPTPRRSLPSSEWVKVKT
jgi:hypothetical protein